MVPNLLALVLQGTVVLGTPPAMVLQRTPTIEVDGNAQWRARWLGDTAIVMIDPGPQAVVELNVRTGTKRSRGGRGAGPGEYANATTPLGDSEGRLLVSDLNLRRITVYDQKRQVLGTYRSQAMIGMPIYWEKDTLLAVWTDTRTMASTLGKIWPSQDGTLTMLQTVSIAEVLSAGAKRDPARPMVPAVTYSSSGELYVAETTVYRVFRVEGKGAGVLVAQREIVLPRLTREQAEQSAGEAARKAGFADQLSPAVRSAMAQRVMETPQPHFPATGLSVDGVGRLWVVTTRISALGTEVDVFCRNGTFLGTVRLRGTVRSLDWRGLKAVAVVEERPDEDAHLGVIDLYQAEHRQGECARR